MNITLYTTNSPQNQINKRLTTVTSLSGYLRDDCSRGNPIIQIEADISTLNSVNYMYIPDFSRYYFVEDIVSIRAGICEIHGRVDVLESFKSDLLDARIILKRQRDNWNLYVDDGSFITYCDDKMYTLNFPGGFNGNTFVLVTTGPYSAPA